MSGLSERDVELVAGERVGYIKGPAGTVVGYAFTVEDLDAFVAAIRAEAKAEALAPIRARIEALSKCYATGIWPTEVGPTHSKHDERVARDLRALLDGGDQ